jgi:hypothetical protein
MSSAYYELYLKDIFDFVGTIVIKSNITAGAINNWLELNQYPIDKTRPETWKYYLNMSGVYHSSDVPMSIKSLDNSQVIDLTVENLTLHRSTRREYRYRSRYYNELVERYPDQEELIQGILNPVSITDAIAAEDHTILYYDKSLVESGEIDLIYNLQLWVNAFFTRWDVPDYSYTESLFTASQLGVLYTFMPKQIINLRLANCKTDRAHSFHIKQYLTSFGRLDPYVDFLNNKQRLFFYRNIRTLNHNSGKNETFELLTKKVMTDRHFPLAEYTIRHNTETLSEDLYPTIELRRKSINGLSSALGEDIKSVRDVLDLEQGLARNNKESQYEAEVNIPRMMKNSLSSTLETKVLESNVLDKTDAEPFTLNDVIFNHWIYFACTGRYNSIFTIPNPNSGEDLYLTSKQMFILWLYVANLAMGYDLPIVPNIIAKRVKRNPLPSYVELRGMTESKYVSDSIIRAALDRQPEIKAIISVDAFKDSCQSIHRASLAHRDLSVYQQHYIGRGQTEMMTDRFYMDYECNLADEIPYSTWLNQLSLDLSKMSEKDLRTLATNIFALTTGQNLVAVKSLQDIHTAHIRLMTQLSSYSVQFIQQINTSSIKIEDWTYIRMGDITSRISDGVRILLRPVTAIEYNFFGKPRYFEDLVKQEMFNPTARLRRDIFIPLNVKAIPTMAGSGHYRQRLSVVHNAMVNGFTIDLSTLTAVTDPIGYNDIPTVPFSDMFSDNVSLALSPLTNIEKEILIRRNL